eukprot:Nitzschia sp. Nitz4//scaffold42_size132992//77996//79270//NITZ4_003403-RA/size132992-augustus-gene-0.114-mRNA-1//-1//CDS//3329551730//6816//frame0
MLLVSAMRLTLPFWTALVFCNTLCLAEFPDIPLIDFGPWKSDNDTERQRVVQQVLHACQTAGFFQIYNHGIDQSVMDSAWNASSDFFEMSGQDKLKHRTTHEAEYPYGYEQSEQLSRGKQLDGVTQDGTTEAVVDTKETFSIGPNNTASGMPPRRWQPTPSIPHFQQALETYYSAMNALADQLFQVFALALNKPESYFVPLHDRHLSALRLVHYFPLTEELRRELVNPAKGSVSTTNWLVRAGAHTDYGAMTILNAQQEGLQILRRDLEDPTISEWYSVPLVEGALNINLGDLMQRWTNDEWVSTLHRVVMPWVSSENKTEDRRYSMAYFVNVNGDTMIQSLVSDNPSLAKYPPISARDHLMAKHLASMGEEMPTIASSQSSNVDQEL